MCVEGGMIRDKKTMKKEILDKFRSMKTDSNYILPGNWLEFDYFATMNREERKIFRQAVKELISLGLVENVRGRELNLKLTQKGEDLIFSEP
jgi:hypothetical protein